MKEDYKTAFWAQVDVVRIINLVFIFALIA
jgi:hypothetical protein